MVSVEHFYGGVSLAQRKIERLLAAKSLPKVTQLPPSVTTLLGPSRTWKIFTKQQCALNYVVSHKSGLMAFAYEQIGGTRLFLVCHPIILWFIQVQRPSTERCTYEIIGENSPSKIYLDIEFEYAFNATKDFLLGQRMVDIFLSILMTFIKENISVTFTNDHLIELDSSTSEKFSRHVILSHPEYAFANNVTVGRIVKDVCVLIKDFIDNESELFGVPVENLRLLQVLDKNGLQKLFVDLSVYSRNRHFRILGSTKRNKNSPLKIVKFGKCIQNNGGEESQFLASLITYFDGKFLQTVEYGPVVPHFHKQESIMEKRQVSTDCKPNVHLDDFINQIISPNGRIRRRLRGSSQLQYDIAGFRFCGNIGREHKSNNISYIVDLEKLMYYQTCYDPDCKRYKSHPINLPTHIALPEEEDDIINEVAENILTDQDLLDCINNCSDSDFSAFFHSDNDEKNQDNFPEMDISDDVLLEIANNSDDIIFIND